VFQVLHEGGDVTESGDDGMVSSAPRIINRFTPMPDTDVLVLGSESISAFNNEPLRRRETIEESAFAEPSPATTSQQQSSSKQYFPRGSLPPRSRNLTLISRNRRNQLVRLSRFVRSRSKSFLCTGTEPNCQYCTSLLDITFAIYYSFVPAPIWGSCLLRCSEDIVHCSDNETRGWNCFKNED